MRLTEARRVVVKVGSALLVDPVGGAVDVDWAGVLADDMARMRARGQEVMLVSSGAVALGRRRLGLLHRTLTLDEKQAAAAAGQSLLMRAWEDAFGRHGLPTAQLLLTRDDTEVRRRWLNARSTVETLLRLGAIPVVNENDTVATEEIRYGDNDRLAARVAQMSRAEALVLLSDIDGLYTADPRTHPDARHRSVVSEVTPEIEAMAGGANQSAGVGVGGMASKVAAAKIAEAAGCDTLIALGRPTAGGGPLAAIEAGARHTLFQARSTPAAAYKQWIGGHLDTRGALTIDAGAATALAEGRSLLAAGVKATSGGFGKGDVVKVIGPDGLELARGVAAFDAEETQAIQGLRSDAIAAALGYDAGPVVIHRDDMVMVVVRPTVRHG